MEEGDCPPTSVCRNQTRDAPPSPNPVGRDNVHFTHILSSSPEQRRARAIKIFKDAMLKLSLSQNPSLSQSEEEMFAKRIDLCLPSLLPSSLHTPNHPPYALMIITALRELNRKKGSKEGSISSFIKSKYQDLPLAHEHLLTHHLETLVSQGEVISVTKSLYTLPGGNDNSEKHQQIAMRGEIVGETGKDDIGGRALIICALPAVVEPGGFDDSGGGLMSVRRKHAHNLVELEPTGSALENSEAVNEVIVPLWRVLPECGRGRRPKKIIEEEQPHNRLDDLVRPVDLDGFCGGLVSLSEKDPLQKILPVREQSRRLKRKRGDEQKKKEVVNTSETIPSSMVIVDAVSKDGDEDLAVENGSQEKKPRGRGRPPKKKHNQKQ